MKTTFKQHLNESAEFLTDADAIYKWLEKKCWLKPSDVKSITSEGIVNLIQSAPTFYITELDTTHLSVQFGEFGRGLSISQCPNLNTLKGCPPLIDGAFNIDRCPSLTSLEHMPSTAQDVSIELENLTSLKGMAHKVARDCTIQYSPISSLEHFPSTVGRNLSLTNTKITSLVGIADHIKCIGVYHSEKMFVCSLDDITSGGIGLILIAHLKIIQNSKDGNWNFLPKPFEIIHKYLGRPDDIFECQSELIENGFEDYAQL